MRGLRLKLWWTHRRWTVGSALIRLAHRARREPERRRHLLNMGGTHPPAVDQPELLVYGECPCGWRMAAPEGSLWPHCPNCGRQVSPPSPTVDAAGRITSKPVRFGYVAKFLSERDAIEELARR